MLYAPTTATPLFSLSDTFVFINMVPHTIAAHIHIHNSLSLPSVSVRIQFLIPIYLLLSIILLLGTGKPEVTDGHK